MSLMGALKHYRWLFEIVSIGLFLMLACCFCRNVVVDLYFVMVLERN